MVTSDLLESEGQPKTRVFRKSLWAFSALLKYSAAGSVSPVSVNFLVGGNVMHRPTITARIDGAAYEALRALTYRNYKGHFLRMDGW